VQTDDELE